MIAVLSSLLNKLLFWSLKWDTLYLELIKLIVTIYVTNPIFQIYYYLISILDNILAGRDTVRMAAADTPDTAFYQWVPFTLVFQVSMISMY